MPAHAWTDEDVAVLKAAVATLGSQWREITDHFFPGRSDDSVRNMYKRVCARERAERTPARPSGVARSKTSRRGFTDEENERLTRMVLDDSMSWEEIAWAMGREGSGRQSLRNRWRRHVLYGDRSRMGTVLMSTREVAVVLRTLDSTQTRRAPGRGA